MRVGLTTTAIFGDLSGYFFGIFRDKASSIIWRHSNPCRPVTDCQMNDLERLFDVKIRFRPALCCRIGASFAAHCTNLNKYRPILSATKIYASESSFWKYKVHADTHRSSSWPGRQTTWGLSTMAIFWRFRWLRDVFENFRDTASNII